jgi:hypothetical protein
VKYRVSGKIEYRVTVVVKEQIIEAESEDDALVVITNDQCPVLCFPSEAEYDDDSLVVVELPEGEVPEDLRMRMLAQPTLWGFV